MSEIVSDGIGFCRDILGVPISEFRERTMRLDKDCFNGEPTIGVKYERLVVDYDKVNYEYYADEEYDPSLEEDSFSKVMDPNWIDEDGNDIFDRIGHTFLGGRGIVTSLYYYLARPALKVSTKLYRDYNLGGLFRYIMMVGLVLLGYELFAVRRLHKRLPCCRRTSSRAEQRRRGVDNMRDVARQARLEHIEARLKKKAEEEKKLRE